MKEASRQQFNVIVSGLREGSSSSDENLFLQLCETHLSVKPSVAFNGTGRLGTVSDDQSRPRRLLVHLRSEASATEVLAAAKELRKSNDTYISRNVFINADLSREEAKLAYEKRLRRRLNVVGGASAMDSHSDVRTDVTSHVQSSDGSSAQASSTNTNSVQPISSYSSSRIFLNSNMNGKKHTTGTFNQSNLIVCSDVANSKLGNTSVGEIMLANTNDNALLSGGANNSTSSDQTSVLNPNSQVFTPVCNSIPGSNMITEAATTSNPVA